jgi:hypothetical protein
MLNKLNLEESQQEEQQQTERVETLIGKHERFCPICKRYLQYFYGTNQSRTLVAFEPIMKHVYDALFSKKGNNSTTINKTPV